MRTRVALVCTLEEASRAAGDAEFLMDVMMKGLLRIARFADYFEPRFPSVYSIGIDSGIRDGVLNIPCALSVTDLEIRTF